MSKGVDEQHRLDAGAAGSTQEPVAPASVPPAEPLPPAPKKVTFRDIYGDLLTPANLWLFGIAALLGVVGLLGGWDKVGAKDAGVATFAPQQQVKAEPLQLEFRKAYWYEQVNGLPAVPGGHRALLVTLDATNTSARPVDAMTLAQAFRLNVDGLVMNFQPAAPEGAKPDLYRASDLTRLHVLQPGLKTRLMLLWTQVNSQALPPQVTVSVSGQTYRKSASDGSMRYFDPAEKARVTLPVTEFKLP